MPTVPLTAVDLAAELARFTYRPGWSLLFEHDPLEGPCLWVVTSQPDSNDPDRRVPLNIRSLIPPIPNTEAFACWLLWRLSLVEIHEAQEWLRRDGVPVSDPHRDRAPPARPETVG